MKSTPINPKHRRLSWSWYGKNLSKKCWKERISGEILGRSLNAPLSKKKKGKSYKNFSERKIKGENEED